MPCDACGKHASQERLYTLWRGGTQVAHFCSLDCTLTWCAEHSAPTVTA